MTKKTLIDELIREGVLSDPRVLHAFEEVDRADFVPESLKASVYDNIPLPIGYGQTISQPYTVAFMLSTLDVPEGGKILEAGAGSGWQTALLAHLVGKKGRVYAFEIIPELKEFGEKNLARSYPDLAKRVTFFAKSAERGLPKEAPFDRIIAAAMLPDIPDAWREQLKTGGKMVFPFRGSIYVLTKKSDTEFEKEVFPGFVFVPFVKKSK